MIVSYFGCFFGRARNLKGVFNHQASLVLRWYQRLDDWSNLHRCHYLTIRVVFEVRMGSLRWGLWKVSHERLNPQRVVANEDDCSPILRKWRMKDSGGR